ncbi:hypothetical protein LWC33_06225 [Pseudonocardia sp. RS11V-5]|uniref:hypothetical protein n=1 Tax=Pseudonocardia terrae TaxID=2905831 RepID=UPI001E569F3E|nr:hypothetical protein [Pseudonocardia terrae]MCE3551051.1 hypothetical protein [Pseudonocardia terrae]
MTAVAVARYLLADAVRSQRVVLPVVLQVAVLAVLFGGDPGRLPAPWGASVLTLYPVAAWLALTIAHTEDPVQRDVTVAAAGGVGPVAAGTLLVALAGDLGLAVLSVLWPVVVTPYPASPSIILTGLLAHLAAGATGTAVGLLCARPWIRRVGRSLLVGAVVVIATAVQPWLPPVGSTVQALADGAGPGAVVLPAALALLLAVLVTWASSVRARRD